MRTLLIACMIAAFILQSGMPAPAAELAATELRIQDILNNLDKQMERIKLAREKADTQMSLARIRIAERLRLSGEDLARQVDALSRIRDQLREATDDTQNAMERLKVDWPGILESALKEIDRQLGETNSLLTQMESIRENFEDQSVQGTSTVSPTSQNASNAPVSAMPQGVPQTTPAVVPPTVSLQPQSGGG